MEPVVICRAPSSMVLAPPRSPWR